MWFPELCQTRVVVTLCGRISFSSVVLAACVLFAAWGITACSPTGSIQIMSEQPRYDPYAPSDFFSDGMSARPVISGTVPYLFTTTNTLLYLGTVNGAVGTTFPFQVTDAVMARGQERYNIYCAPCHSALGDGKGLVAQRGFCCPASFHTDRLRNAPVGHFFDVITNGIGAMRSYGTDISPRDRWAIIAYVRALQLSQHAAPEDVPPAQRDGLGQATPTP